MLQPVYDVLVIGGGPGGLSVATALARQLYTAVVFSNGTFRNARADHMHNVPGWDHQSPTAYRAKAKDDLLKRYETITFQENTTVTLLEKLENGHFQVTDENGKTWEGLKVVLAHGITDILPASIPGYDECWGRSVFHCLFCHGYEERGAEHVGVLATGVLSTTFYALHIARLAARLAKTVTIYTNGNQKLADEITTALHGKSERLNTDTREVASMQKLPEGSKLAIRFKNGEEETLGFLAHKPGFRLNGGFAKQLGLQISEQGRYVVSHPFQETTAKGVFAAGDCSSLMEAVTIATSTGAMAAVGATMQIIAEAS